MSAEKQGKECPRRADGVDGSRPAHCARTLALQCLPGYLRPPRPTLSQLQLLAALLKTRILCIYIFHLSYHPALHLFLPRAAVDFPDPRVVCPPPPPLSHAALQDVSLAKAMDGFASDVAGKN